MKSTIKSLPQAARMIQAMGHQGFEWAQETRAKAAEALKTVMELGMKLCVDRHLEELRKADSAPADRRNGSYSRHLLTALGEIELSVPGAEKGSGAFLLISLCLPCNTALDATPPEDATGGLVYHVLNRRTGRLPLFDNPPDFEAFEKFLGEVYERTKTRIVAYCLMPNHWHVVRWPREDGELSEVMRWLTVTHTQRWHAVRKTAGTGLLYQGRFKSFPIQADEHFVTVVRYVEANPLRAGLVKRAEDWRWSSLWWFAGGSRASPLFLSQWPVERPRRWLAFVNGQDAAQELEELRCAAERGRPFGSSAWVTRTAKRLGLESTLRPRGRPKKS